MISIHSKPSFPHIPTKKYQLLVTFGNGFVDADKGILPEHVLNRLDYLNECYKSGVAPMIVLGGNKSKHEPYVPIKESEQMAAYLHNEHDIPYSAMLLEGSSENCRENVLYLKTDVLIPHGYRDMLVICPDYQKERFAFLLPKILGPEYSVAIQGFETQLGKDPEVIASKVRILEAEKRFFARIPDGAQATAFLKTNLSVDPYKEINPVAIEIALGRKK